MRGPDSKAGSKRSASLNGTSHRAVIGSYLQRWAYPDFYKQHVERNGRELINWTRGKIFDGKTIG